MTVQLSVAAGALTGLGVALVLWRLTPAQPQLRGALDGLTPQRTTTAVADPAETARDRVGLWAQRRIPVAAWGTAPTRDLALLRVSVHGYYSEKALFALVGLLALAAFTAGVTLAGATLPFAVPVAAILALTAALFFLPNYNARSDAKAAREEFARALGAYIDLVALERAGGAGSTQSLEKAADVGDSWVFRRIREELARARWSGLPPWGGLSQLAEELALPDLRDLADIMRLSGNSARESTTSSGPAPRGYGPRC